MNTYTVIYSGKFFKIKYPGPIIMLPETQARALAGLNDRLFYYLGHIAVKVSGCEQEELATKTEMLEQS